MDLVAITRQKVDLAGPGQHQQGLLAVLSHAEAAVAHLERGRSSDETAFTDAVYRTNQVFEGSLKEAYRVLAGKDPDRKTPHEIEKYLEERTIFRRRVLAQFTMYRTEWRNPSAHDYKLDFDAAEAFLAIVSVFAFVNLVLDQIIEKLAHDKAKATAEARKDAIRPLLEGGSDLEALAARLLVEFAKQYSPNGAGPRMREAELLGAISGFFEAALPDVKVQVEAPLGHRGRLEADILLKRGAEQLLVEIKQIRDREPHIKNALEQLDRYMAAASVDNALLFLTGWTGKVKKLAVDRRTTPAGRLVTVVAPII